MADGDTHARRRAVAQRRIRIADLFCGAGGTSTGLVRALRQLARDAGLLEDDVLAGTAFALRADGWYLRQDIIWSKPNPMPESVRDRCTKAHEYLFLLSKTDRYYFDAEAIAEPLASSGLARLAQDVAGQAGSHRVPGKTNGAMKAVRRSGNLKRKPSTERGCPAGSGSNVCGSIPWEGDTRNKRSVWTIPTMPFREAHFATFPEALIEPCILAGAPAGGVVLDPFMGAGTTAVVAERLGRRFVGCELKSAYAEIARARIDRNRPFWEREGISA